VSNLDALAREYVHTLRKETVVEAWDPELLYIYIYIYIYIVYIYIYIYICLYIARVCAHVAERDSS